MTGKTAQMLLPDIHELREAAMPWRCALSEEYDANFIELWWCSTKVQLADNLTKIQTPSQTEFMNVLETNVVTLGVEGKDKDWLRPRDPQRAHSFGTFVYHCFDILQEIYTTKEAQCFCHGTPVFGKGHECEFCVDPLPGLRDAYDAYFQADW